MVRTAQNKLEHPRKTFLAREGFIDRFSRAYVTVLDRNLPIEQIIMHPPIAVFEIISPEDTMTRVMRKLNDYSAMGIEHIWVIDPANRTSYRLWDGQLNLSSTFGGPGEAIHFHISDIEKLLD